MKIVKVTKVVPEQKIETEQFVCEICGYTTVSQQDAKKHDFEEKDKLQNAFAKESVKVDLLDDSSDYVTLLKFDSYSDLVKFAEHRYDYSEVNKENFNGWAALEWTEVYRYGDYDQVQVFRNPKDILDRTTRSLKILESSVDKLRRALAAIENA